MSFLTPADFLVLCSRSWNILCWGNHLSTGFADVLRQIYFRNRNKKVLGLWTDVLVKKAEVLKRRTLMTSALKSVSNLTLNIFELSARQKLILLWIFSTPANRNSQIAWLNWIFEVNTILLNVLLLNCESFKVYRSVYPIILSYEFIL